MIYILICDDDPIMLSKINKEIQSLVSLLEIKAKIYCYTNISNISDQILASCDVVLLDVDFQTEEYNGLDLARRLRKFRNDSIVIFITNFIEYAPEGYEVHAFRYILKNKFGSDIKTYFKQAIEEIHKRKEVIKIQVNSEIIDLNIQSILYFEVQQHNISAYVLRSPHRREVKIYTFYGSLSDFERRLEPQGFLRIHKSF